MKYTRRSFLEAAVAGAAGLRPTVAALRQSSAGIRQAGAPGVQLNVDVAALPDYSRDLERYLIRLSDEARQRRKHVIDAISTRQDVLDRQRSVVAELWKMLGGPLDRNPLNPRVTGTIERPGYRIEKLTFESRPRLYVTANLYLPAGTGRHPAILSPLGHSENGKAWPSYQKLFSQPGPQRLCGSCVRPVRPGGTHRVPGRPPRPVRDPRRRNGRARVRRASPDPPRRQLRPVPHVGRHPRDRLPADASRS